MVFGGFMKKIELSQKHWIIIIVCAVLVVTLVATCLIAANVSDKSRFTYELKADGTYKIVNLKNSYRGGMFAKKSITIPDTYKKKPVTQIDKFETSAIEEVIISEGITTISQRAFANSSIKTIKLPNSLSTIGTGAFANCNGLTKIELPENIKAVSRDAFSGCANLAEIKLSSKTETIENGAFSGCKALENISIPTTVTNLGDGAFSNSGLKSLTVPHGVTQINKNLFAGCENLSTVTLSDATASIKEGAFNGCKLLASINLSDSLTSVEHNSFDNCSETLLKVYNGGIYIGNAENPYLILLKSADSEANQLTTHNQTTLIANNAFARNEKLTVVTTNEGLKIIGDNAFNGCKALETVILAKSLSDIRDNAFANCDKLAAVTQNNAPFEMSNTNTSLNAFAGTPYYNAIAAANKGLILSGGILYGIDSNILAKSFAKDSVTDYDVYLTLQDKVETKSTKLRIKGEDTKITVYVVTGEGAEEKLEIYLSVNAQYETN